MSEPRHALLSEAVATAFGSTTKVTDVQPLAGDASTRSYERVWLSGSGPRTTIAMWCPDRGVAMSSDELAVLPDSLDELPFVNVQRFLQTIGVDVPAIYADFSRRRLLLLEDVGDYSLWDATSQARDPATVEHLFRRAIDQLVRLQLQGTAAATPDCIAFHQQFDARLYLWEYHHFLEWGIERPRGSALPAAQRHALEEELQHLATELDSTPRFLAHRDFHAWNLFVQPPERIRVLDFQDALLATPAYDLATLLGDRDTPALIAHRQEQRLLEHFLDAWHAEKGPTLPPLAFRTWYARCALQKALKVVGRFHFLALAKQKPQYLRYIPATLHQIRRLLPQFPHYRTLAEVVATVFPE